MSDNTVDPAKVLSDGLGDWRFRAVHHIERNGNPALLAAIGELKAPTGETFTFHDFMSAALFLNVTMEADKRANALREQLRPEVFTTPRGPYTAIPHHLTGLLFDFIEQSAVAAISSCQALEAFCNFTIRMHLENREHMFRLRSKPKQLYLAEEIERFGELGDKMKSIVPQLLKIQPPTKADFWMPFCHMKDLRDALVHPKFHDQMAAASIASQSDDATREDPSSAYYRIVSGQSKDFSKTATLALNYFHQKEGTPRWLRYPLQVAGIEATPQTGKTTLTLSPPS